MLGVTAGGGGGTCPCAPRLNLPLYLKPSIFFFKFDKGNEPKIILNPGYLCMLCTHVNCQTMSLVF